MRQAGQVYFNVLCAIHRLIVVRRRDSAPARTRLALSQLDSVWGAVHDSPDTTRLHAALRKLVQAAAGLTPEDCVLGYPRISFALVLYFDVHISIEHILFREKIRSKFEISIRNLKCHFEICSHVRTYSL